MKTIILFLLLLVTFFSEAQQHTQLRAKQLIADSSVTLRRIRADSIRLDTANWLGDVHSPAMVDAIYRFVKGRVDNVNVTVVGCEKRTTSPYSINWAGTGFDFVVSAGTYSIDCNNYSNPVTPISLTAADPSNDRTDVVYLDATGVHVLTGVVAPPGTSVKPLVQGDQIELTSILVGAGATTPTLTEVVIYDENTESVVTNVGTTTNADYLTNPYHLTKSVLIGTLTNNDLIIFTKASGSWDFLSIDAMTFFIKLNAVMAGSDNLRVALYNGTQQVSSEVVVAIDKLNTTDWQGVSISKGTFGTLLNSNVTSVRFRATIGSSSAAAPQIDFIKTVSGIVVPPGTTTVTASEGLTKSGDDIRYGGLSTAPGLYTTDRWINQNRKVTVWTNGAQSVDKGVSGAQWDFGQQVYSPYQFLSRDTAVQNTDPPTAGVPWSGIFARRDLYFPSGTWVTQKVFGHQFEMRWLFDDTMHLRTEQGDYNAGFSIKDIYKPYGTGRQGIRINGTLSPNQIDYAAPALLVVKQLRDTTGNYIKINGHTSGINSYFVGSSYATDTVKGHVFYTTGAFGNTFFNKIYDFAPTARYRPPTFSDSAFLIWDTTNYKNNHFGGKSVYGPSKGTANAWASTDVFKILGNLTTTDTVVVGAANAVSDSTNKDFAIRNRITGGIERMRFDQALAILGAGEATSIGSFQTTSTANGLSLSGTAVRLHAASATNPGGIIVGSGLSIDGSGVLSTTGGATPGIDDVLAVGQSLTTNRTLNMAGSTFKISTTGGDAVTFNNNKSIRMHGYGAGTFTGTPAKYPAWDASGNLIEMNFLPMTLQDVLNNDNIANNTNILMNGSAQLIFDYSSGHGITWRSGTSIGTSTEVYLQNSPDNDSSFRFMANGTPFPLAVDLDMAKITALRHIYWPDASGTIALTSDIPAGGGGTVNAGAANRLAYYPSASTTVDDLAAITANRAIVSDANGLPVHATTTDTEIGYVNGVTSAIQTQLNGKATLALDNLASVQTNADIVPAADVTRDMGSSTKAFKDTYTKTIKYKGATSGTITVEAQATAISPLVTTTTGQGYGCSCMEARETSDFTGQNINTVQPMFSTSIDVWPLQGSTAYDFEGFISLDHGATSHSVGLSFELSGGASVTSISYMTLQWVTAIGTQTASQTTNFVQVATNTAVNAAGANATEQIYFKGTINMNAAGNVTPSYTFSAAPGGTPKTKAGSYIRFCPKGTNTFTNIGPAN